MQDLIEILLLIGIPISAALFWSDSMRARERAITVCRLTCNNYGAQLLDQTVSLHRIRLHRDDRGRVRFHRSYRFDYSYDGTDRYRGNMVMLGAFSELIHIDPPQAPTTSTSSGEVWGHKSSGDT